MREESHMRSIKASSEYRPGPKNKMISDAIQYENGAAADELVGIGEE